MEGMREISIVTLGVADIETSCRFYESLGFQKSISSDDKIVWFRTKSTILALYPWNLLAEDIGTLKDGSGFRGVTMALNMVSKELVDHMIEIARSNGAKILKEPQMVFWGGYSSYFADPDGHIWEVAWNPYTPVDADGRLDIKR